MLPKIAKADGTLANSYLVRWFVWEVDGARLFAVSALPDQWQFLVALRMLHLDVQIRERHSIGTCLTHALAQGLIFLHCDAFRVTGSRVNCSSHGIFQLV